MAIDGRLNFDTKIDTKGFSKGINSLGNQLNNLRNIVLKMGAALGTVFSGKEALEAAADKCCKFSNATDFWNFKICCR